MYLFPRAATTNYHSWWLKTTGLILSQSLESASLKSRCRKAMLPLKVLGKTPSCPCLASGGSQQYSMFMVCSCVTPVSASIFMCPFLSVSSPLSKRTLIIRFGAHKKTLYFCTDYICKGPISKKGHIQKSLVNMNFRGYYSTHYKI